MKKIDGNCKTVTIGIPVYNEQRNIGSLIQSLLAQHRKNFIMKTIVISSDGSTDKTVSIIKKFRNPLVKLIVNKHRKGIARGLNQINSLAKSDILVMLNGDIVVRDPDFVSKLITPVYKNQADLVSCAVKEIRRAGLIEKILSVGATYRTNVFRNFKNGNNMYTCHGQARAFSKRMYSSIRYPVSYGDDMYSYFYAKQNGFRYSYVKNTSVYYYVPATIADHKKQSVRYMLSIRLMETLFGQEFIREHHAWPRSLFFTQGVQMLIQHPLETVSYPFIYVLMWIQSKFSFSVSDTWDPAESTKLI